MLRCTDCENIFDEYEADEYEEDMGEFWGMPAFETWLKCPHCGGTDIEDYYEDEEEMEEEE